jgi:hypothetical protein
MAVTDQTISMFAGNRRILRFSVTDEDVAGSPPKDLTGLRLQFALARFTQSGQPSVATPVVDLNSVDDAAQVTMQGVDDEIIQVELLPANTQSLRAGDYYFEAEVVDGSGNSTVVATGTLTLNPNVVNS